MGVSGRIPIRCEHVTRHCGRVWSVCVALVVIGLGGCPKRPQDGSVQRDVPAIWARIEAWLERRAPSVLAGLAGPADKLAVEQAERELGMALPDDLRASLAIHDGEARDVGLVRGMTLNGLETMMYDWRAMEKLRVSGIFGDAGAVRTQAGLRPGHWHRGWLPIASTGDGDSWSLDLDPGAGGRVGQVFYFDHELGPRAVAFPSFTAWLDALLVEMEAGKISLDPAGGLRVTTP